MNDYGNFAGYKIIEIGIGSRDKAYQTIILKDKTQVSIPCKVDEASWQYLGAGFSKDKNSVYKGYENAFSKKSYEYIDIESFDILHICDEYGERTYFKDKNSVYFYSISYTDLLIIDGADIKSFEVIDEKNYYAKDSKNYFWEKSMLTYNPKELKEINRLHGEANGKIYYSKTLEIIGADPHTFNIVCTGDENLDILAKDKNSVYLRGVQQTNIDSGSFEIIKECINSPYNCDNYREGYKYYARDKNNVYFFTTFSNKMKRVATKNLSSFTYKIIKKKGYGFDGEFYYDKTKKVNV